MKRQLFRSVLAAVPVLALSSILPAPAAQGRSLVLDNVRIIDGTGAAPIEKARIVIDGDRITPDWPGGNRAGACRLPSGSICRARR